VINPSNGVAPGENGMAGGQNDLRSAETAASVGTPARGHRPRRSRVETTAERLSATAARTAEARRGEIW